MKYHCVFDDHDYHVFLGEGATLTLAFKDCKENFETAPFVENLKPESCNFYEVTDVSIEVETIIRPVVKSIKGK